MSRLMLNNELWLKLDNMLLQQAINYKPHLWITTDGGLYRMREGCHWRDRSVAFGRWHSDLQTI